MSLWETFSKTETWQEERPMRLTISAAPPLRVVQQDDSHMMLEMDASQVALCLSRLPADALARLGDAIARARQIRAMANTHAVPGQPPEELPAAPRGESRWDEI